MSIKIVAGEYLYNASGHHICDAQGFATKAEAETILTFDSPQIEGNVLNQIRTMREFRGMDPDTGLPPVEE